MTDHTHDTQTSRLEAMRARLAQVKGRQYWKSLEELAQTDEFKEHLQREFPRGAAQWMDPISRRNFLKLMGASLALAGVIGCTRQPDEKMYPYSDNPERIIPGLPKYYATAMVLGGYAKGVYAESHTGRPTKLEGNPDHPASLGATDVFAQASILTLYDPDRSQVASTRDAEGNRTNTTWDTFVSALSEQLGTVGANGGQGMHILTETVTSPTFASQMQALLQTFPNALWHQYEPLAPDNAKGGAQLAFGEQVETFYDVSPANIIVSIDSDFLTNGTAELRYARQFTTKRRVWENNDEMSRMYAVQATPNDTNAMADHVMPLKPSHIEAFTRLLAQRLGVEVEQSSGFADGLTEMQSIWMDGLVSDLQANQGASLVVAGDEQPPVVHALVHAINGALGNIGTTVFYIDPVAVPPNDGAPSQLASLQSLVTAMDAGEVQFLLVVDANPAFTAPVDFDFATKLAQVPFSVHMGVYMDETGQLCTWHVPETHYLEAWGDARAFDGTTTIIQPLIAPLYDGRTPHELLAAMNGDTTSIAYDLVRNYWTEQVGAGEIEQFWQISLNNGLVAGSELAPRTMTPALQNLPAPTPTDSEHELIFRADPAVWDGRFSNNGWLQEMPRPITRISWDNAALISPRTAVDIFSIPDVDVDNLTPEDYPKLAESNGRVVELNYDSNRLRIPVWVVPGHADDTITVHLGYGRSDVVGNVGTEVGFNTYMLRASAAPWSGPVIATSVGSYHRLVSTQDHHSMEERGIVRGGTLEDYRADPGFVGTLQEFPSHPDRSIFQDLFPYEGNYSWGMVIDMNTFIDSRTSVIACQAENNIPIVGKDEVQMGREMHWLRVDRYYGGDLNNPVMYQQPMACVHCELAPCEIVCPVNATVHDHEGLNVMVYNRCVGTKYCSNNCPYKVRRFNFFYYTDQFEDTPSLKLLQNPDVTVRSRGVMEKCTYCIQRIAQATITAKNEGRDIEDGEVLPACAQANAGGAIIFGDLNNQESRVSQLKQLPLNYGVLEEFNFFPRTTHIARLFNPNPAIGMREQAEFPEGGASFVEGGHGEGGHGEGEGYTEEH